MTVDHHRVSNSPRHQHQSEQAGNRNGNHQHNRAKHPAGARWPEVAHDAVSGDDRHHASAAVRTAIAVHFVAGHGIRVLAP